MKVGVICQAAHGSVHARFVQCALTSLGTIAFDLRMM